MYLTVIMVCISQMMTDDVGHFPWAYWPFVDFLWRNVKSFAYFLIAPGVS